MPAPADCPLAEDVERLKEVIAYEKGNLTRAARKLEVSKTYVMMLVKRYDLTAWARAIRLQNGLPATGNPHLDRPSKSL